ncbi:Wzz/FepE/Etk N-terminal domain-containing protein [Massilia sp. P8910]|uniref:Chain length-determining protein n=1 Tax=Massilia antarctica TaxID=2765360 RepID=A0AA48WH57_9BURK|nr:MULTISPECIES: XrtA system polysaccharide chain length determinant [Massilia]CUI06516.1 Lipopolysaccharide biosynthesis chain length determinant protein [Janthinobacterium sp. CG23_2]MCE3607676.1 Wzz/FepE/Etk N-terminal domain-containing protein [Massilia antarctica]MCY0912020.1 Wzz/FepE/Etk N-terminal domain-containing protein [Massilia sp. H27-R4]QPI51592.1 chain length-determining protein [Massilia antarctica]CUU30302.1 Lipopolysaccharide biosynthesis chain length determinant protein [Jan
MAELQALLTNFLKAIWKYRWYAVVISWIVALVGWAVVYRLPNEYQASARVYVDTQSILQPLLAGMTTVPNVDQQVAFMRRTLISRPNVERVMRMVDLDIKASTPKENEKLVDDLMAQISIGGTERDDIYTISYKNSNPKLGKDIVQSLLTIFVEGSFGGKKQDSEKAVQFIDDQIKNYEEKLVQAENALKEFKIKHLGMLPRGGGSDFTTNMTQIEDLLNQARLELTEAEQARNAIKRQIAGEEPAPLTAPEASGVANPELDSRIAALNKNLDSLRMQYTDAHPDIVSARRLIAQLEARKLEEAKRNKRNNDPGANYSPMLQQMNVALSVEEARVASLKARVAEYGSRAARLRSQSSNAPEVEAQLAQLNRDYVINKENYEKLVGRREAAKLSGDLSSATDMLTFRVIDPPTVPSTPSGPNRHRLFSFVFAAALLAGLGVAFLMSQLRPTFMSQGTLRDVTGIPILGSISMNWTNEQKVMRTKRLYAFGAAVIVLFGAYGGVMAALFVRPLL